MIVRTRHHMKKVADSRPVQSALFEGLPAKGMGTPRSMRERLSPHHQQRRPIVKPDDLKGIELQSPGRLSRVNMFKDYGANPSPIAAR